MNSTLKTTKEALAILRCANSTFHSHLEKQAIKAIRIGTRSFFTLEQIEILKNSIDNELAQANSDESGKNIAGLEEDPDEERHNQELIDAQEEIQMLSIQVSQWQQQAQTYQEQYQKLLNSRQEEKRTDKSTEKNTVEKRWWDIFLRRVV